MIGNIDILVKELCKLPKEGDGLSSNITIASRQWLARTEQSLNATILFVIIS